MKLCSHCHIVKDISEFPVYSCKGNKIRRGQCRPCYNTICRAYRNKNPDKVKIYNRRGALRHKYNISVEEYELKLKSQNSVCAICGKGPGKYRLAVDHDHASGQLRDILCNVCNKYLHVLEDWAFLENAKAYLTKWKGK